jgi:hypothetical protein
VTFSDGISVEAKPADAEGKIEITVNIAGKVTKSEFQKVIKQLGAAAPDVGGFRKKKGGKNVLSDAVLLNMLGKKRVYGFLLDNLVSQTMLDFTSEVRGRGSAAREAVRGDTVGEIGSGPHPNTPTRSRRG